MIDDAWCWDDLNIDAFRAQRSCATTLDNQHASASTLKLLKTLQQKEITCIDTVHAIYNHLTGTFPSSVCLACLHKSSVLPWQGLGTLSACLDALDLVAVHDQLVLLTNLHFVLELAVHGVVPSRDGTLTAGSGRQEEPCVSSLDLDGLCWLLRLGKIKTQPTHPTALLPAKANCCAKHFI